MTTIGAGMRVRTREENLPVWEVTVKATGFLPWRTIEEVELLEVSFVEFPANPHCYTIVVFEK